MNTVNESCDSRTQMLHVVSEVAEKLYYYVQWIGHFVCNRDFYIKRSHFDSFLLLYTLRGSGVLHYGGRSYPLSPKTLMLIDCKQVHEYYPIGDGWEFKHLHFNGVMCRAYYDYITKLYGGVVFPASEKIEHYMDTLYQMTERSEAEEICSDYIDRILTRIIYGIREEKELTVSPGWLTEVIERIAQTYHQEISVEDLAKQVHFSRCYFSGLFKKYTGFSPHQYILNYRITEAKRLLYSTSLSVDSIAHHCGFQDTASFIRAFRNRMQVSPLVFRKKGVLDMDE